MQDLKKIVDVSEVEIIKSTITTNENGEFLDYSTNIIKPEKQLKNSEEKCILISVLGKNNQVVTYKFKPKNQEGKVKKEFVVDIIINLIASYFKQNDEKVQDDNMAIPLRIKTNLEFDSKYEKSSFFGKAVVEAFRKSAYPKAPVRVGVNSDFICIDELKFPENTGQTYINDLVVLILPTEKNNPKHEFVRGLVRGCSHLEHPNFEQEQNLSNDYEENKEEDINTDKKSELNGDKIVITESNVRNKESQWFCIKALKYIWNAFEKAEPWAKALLLITNVIASLVIATIGLMLEAIVRGAVAFFGLFGNCKNDDNRGGGGEQIEEEK